MFFLYILISVINYVWQTNKIKSIKRGVRQLIRGQGRRIIRGNPTRFPRSSSDLKRFLLALV